MKKKMSLGQQGLRVFAAGMMAAFLNIFINLVLMRFLGPRISILMLTMASFIILTLSVYAFSRDNAEQDAAYYVNRSSKRDLPPLVHGLLTGLIGALPFAATVLLPILAKFGLFLQQGVLYRLLNMNFYWPLQFILPYTSFADATYFELFIATLLNLYIPFVSTVGYAGNYDARVAQIRAKKS